MEPKGEAGLRIVCQSESFDFVLADAGARDAWITAANEVLARRKCLNAASEQQAKAEEERRTQRRNDDDRWQKKHDELEMRREERLSARKKYEGAGSEHTESAKKRRQARI